MDFGGQPLAVGIGVHSWQREELKESTMSLLREALTLHFPTGYADDVERLRILAPQVGYAVIKSS